MRIDAVVFDIGNVLLEWNPEAYYDRLIGEASRRRMFESVDLAAMNRRLDLGAPWRDLVYATAAAHPEFEEPIRHWHDHWIDIASPAIPDSVALLRAVKSKGLPVFTLTNFGAESFVFAQTHYAFLTEFDRYYVSGRMEGMKPDPEIFARVEADCGLPPERLLFTDDRPENVAAAAARGWQVHLFDGAAGWAAALVAHGVLAPEEAAA